MEGIIEHRMKDFSYKIYARLLDTLSAAGYSFITFGQYCLREDLPEKFVILRHDVDRIAWNAVVMARMEHAKNIKASYYFRVAEEAYDEKAIKEIISLGHEGGYHYEDMDLSRGDIDLAYQLYLKNLAHFNSLFPVRTICMHGSPLSKYDNRQVWRKYDYKQHGVIGEPYFDVDYTNLFYITDTGRQWNNAAISVRDKVESPFHFNIKGTHGLISLLEEGVLPDQLMINTHPHRWFNNIIPWTKELIFQNLKNQVKKIVIRNNHKTPQL